MAAGIALGKVSSHAFCPAGGHIGKRPSMAWQDSVTEFAQVLSTVSSHDVGEFYHGARLAVRRVRTLPK